MEQPVSNWDVNLALGAPMGGVIRRLRPETIPIIQEEHAEFGPQTDLLLPVVLQEQEAAPHTEDTLLDLVMANARDLQTFREYEGYHFGQVDSDSESDVPENYSSESEDEAEEVVPIEEHID